MTQEKAIRVSSGWGMLAFNLSVLLAGIFGTIGVIIAAANSSDGKPALLLLLTIPTVITALTLLGGHFTLQPNEARVLTLFGTYVGTVRESGFYWTNPFMTKSRISLRSRNMESQRLKVNDKRGNPIEIAAVVVWRVEDTAEASVDVENWQEDGKIQSESAVRHLANEYAYDHGEEGETTLRSGVDEVSSTLQRELQERLAKAGVVVEECRLTHLAYAPEIAGAMLRR